MNLPSDIYDPFPDIEVPSNDLEYDSPPILPDSMISPEAPKLPDNPLLAKIHISMGWIVSIDKELALKGYKFCCELLTSNLDPSYELFKPLKSDISQSFQPNITPMTPSVTDSIKLLLDYMIIHRVNDYLRAFVKEMERKNESFDEHNGDQSYDAARNQALLDYYNKSSHVNDDDHYNEGHYHDHDEHLEEDHPQLLRRHSNHPKQPFLKLKRFTSPLKQGNSNSSMRPDRYSQQTSVGDIASMYLEATAPKESDGFERVYYEDEEEDDDDEDQDIGCAEEMIGERESDSGKQPRIIDYLIKCFLVIVRLTDDQNRTTLFDYITQTRIIDILCRLLYCLINKKAYHEVDRNHQKFHKIHLQKNLVNKENFFLFNCILIILIETSRGSFFLNIRSRDQLLSKLVKYELCYVRELRSPIAYLCSEWCLVDFFVSISPNFTPTLSTILKLLNQLAHSIRRNHKKDSSYHIPLDDAEAIMGLFSCITGLCYNASDYAQVRTRPTLASPSAAIVRSSSSSDLHISEVQTDDWENIMNFFDQLKLSNFFKICDIFINWFCEVDINNELILHDPTNTRNPQEPRTYPLYDPNAGETPSLSTLIKQTKPSIVVHNMLCLIYRFFARFYFRMMERYCIDGANNHISKDNYMEVAAEADRIMSHIIHQQKSIIVTYFSSTFNSCSPTASFSPFSPSPICPPNDDLGGFMEMTYDSTDVESSLATTTPRTPNNHNNTTVSTQPASLNLLPLPRQQFNRADIFQSPIYHNVPVIHQGRRVEGSDFIFDVEILTTLLMSIRTSLQMYNRSHFTAVQSALLSYCHDLKGFYQGLNQDGVDAVVVEGNLSSELANLDLAPSCQSPHHLPHHNSTSPTTLTNSISPMITSSAPLVDNYNTYINKNDNGDNKRLCLLTDVVLPVIPSLLKAIYDPHTISTTQTLRPSFVDPTNQFNIKHTHYFYQTHLSLHCCIATIRDLLQIYEDGDDIDGGIGLVKFLFDVDFFNDDILVMLKPPITNPINNHMNDSCSLDDCFAQSFYYYGFDLAQILLSILSSAVVLAEYDQPNSIDLKYTILNWLHNSTDVLGDLIEFKGCLVRFQNNLANDKKLSNGQNDLNHLKKTKLPIPHPFFHPLNLINVSGRPTTLPFDDNCSFLNNNLNRLIQFGHDNSHLLELMMEIVEEDIKM